MRLNTQKGFTLLEVLIAVGLIAVLAGAVIVALDPARMFAQARNSQRSRDLSAVMNGIMANLVDNRGLFTCAAIPTSATVMSSSGGYDICGCLVPTYTGAIPFDPSAAGAHYASCTDYNMNYTIQRSTSTGSITLVAPTAELGAVITLTK